VFVTSDTFDLKRIGRFRGFDWQENLLCGVAFHGSQWLGYQSLARFYIEAANYCRLMDEMQYAGYSLPDQSRTRPIAPKSFERLARGELKGAKRAYSVLLRGLREAPGAQGGKIIFGGEGGGRADRIRGSMGPGADQETVRRALDADFIFPISPQALDTAIELFRLAVDLCQAEYGYYFIRDELCFPGAYPNGIGAALDYSPLAYEETKEVGAWSDFARPSGLWSAPWPTMRDLFEVNLMSERHIAKPIDGLGYLTDWISAQPGRGRIQDLAKERWLWILTDAEMFNVRPLLNQAGLLLSCRNRVYRDLPHGPVQAANA